MSDNVEPSGDQRYLSRAVEVATRLVVLAVMIVSCYMICSPFLVPIIWGIIIAIATRSTYAGLASALGGRRKLAAVVFSIVGIALLLLPVAFLLDSLVRGAGNLAEGLQQGDLIPPPPESVAEWPVIGERLEGFWSLASDNLSAALRELRPQAESVALGLLSAGANVGWAILQFVIAIIIAAALLAQGTSSERVAHAVAVRLVGRRGVEFVGLIDATVRSVAQGVVGVAIIQSMLAGLGFLVVGLPGAGLWALVTLILCVVQVGPTLVILPAVVWAFATKSTGVAVAFLVWGIVVTLVDNLLRPLLLGRGVDIPMVAIFIGAVGGLISMGIIGLFIGAVVMALAYKLLKSWLAEASSPPDAGSDVSTPTPAPEQR